MKALAACIAIVLAAACGTPAPVEGLPDSAHESDSELRGVWITRFAYASQSDLEGIIDRAAAAHFNAVFVQIRAEGDAYYASAYEPWAKRLTGVLGRSPGWDPLRVAIDRAHMHGMELHAYFNVFTAWNAAQPVDAAEGPIEHPLVAHPEWLAVDSSGTNRDTEYRWFATGNAAVHAHIVATARDVLTHYDVDGLHLDRIRAPGPDYSRDAATTTAFDAARATNPALTWDDFMRAQVNAMVAAIHDVLVQTRPSAKLSAAVWGIYKPLPNCSTSQGYGQYYQDSLAWLAAESIDAIVPMMYWAIEPGACTDWSALLDGFLAGRADRQIWAGMHALDRNAWSFDKVLARIERSRVAGAHGTVIFASAHLDVELARWHEFIGNGFEAGPYLELAIPPTMSWK